MLLIEKPISKKIRSENIKDNMVQTKLNGKFIIDEKL